MKRFRSNSQLYAFLMLVTLTSACAVGLRSPITAVPTGVNVTSVQAWGTAVDGFHVIMTARASADAILRPLVLNKTVPVSVLKAMVKIDGYSADALDILDKNPDNFSQPIAAQVTALASQILTEIANLNAPKLPATATSQVAKMDAAATKVQAMRGVN